MESAVADHARCSGPDRHRGGAGFMNPAVNAGFTAFFSMPFIAFFVAPADPGMAPVATPFFFYLLSGFAVAGGLLVITRHNPVHCALALILNLIAIAHLYLMLYAPFVAGVQIIVYAGGIMVLFLFVIMLVNIERASKDRRFNRMWPAGLAAAGGLLALFVTAFIKGRAVFPDRMVALPESSNTQQIATMLYGE